MFGKTVRILLVCVLLATAQVAAFSQAKIYTRKIKLEDFSVKTMKVVAEGDIPLISAIRSEIAGRWRLSPYEFCTASDYEKLKGDNGFYFLHLVTEDGIAFLLLEKGGKADEADRKMRPFEVVRVPIGSAGSSYTFGIPNLDVFIDIIQKYAQDAMASDKFGYGGLDMYNTSSMRGKTIVIGGNADEMLASGTPDMVVGLSFVPDPAGQWCYKMLVDACTHELFFFDRTRYRNESDASFNAIELKSFELRHAVFAE